MRLDQNPLRQFSDIPMDVIKRLEACEMEPTDMIDMDDKEIGILIHNQKLGKLVYSLLRYLPRLHVEATVQPITRGILRISLEVSCDFIWNDRYHGTVEPFWIWVEDGENECIYHSETFNLLKKQKDEVHKLVFTIPVREPLPPQYYVRVVSDRWVGCKSVLAVSFQHLILPDQMPPHTELLDIHPIPRSALRYPEYEKLCSFTHFNPIQSQVFHALYHSDVNVLIGAPTGLLLTVIDVYDTATYNALISLHLLDHNAILSP